jgi:hypothetical protein
MDVWTGRRSLPGFYSSKELPGKGAETYDIELIDR